MMLFGIRLPIVVDADLDGDPIRITMDHPDGSTACLWALLDDWKPLLPGALPDDQRAYWEDRLADPDDPLDWAALRPLAFAAARRVYGVAWWSAHRILQEAAEAPLLYEMWCVRHAFDPADQPAHRIVASAAACVASAWSDEAQATSWSQRVSMAPPGVVT